MIGVWMFHTGIGVRLRHMGIKVPLRRTRIGVGLHHTGIRVRLFHMLGMVRFCGAVFPYGFEGAPVRILGMVPGPGLSCGLSYAVGIRKPFQVINILPGCRKSGLRHFFEVFIPPLRLRRGQGAMQGNPCYARLFADLPYTPQGAFSCPFGTIHLVPPNPIKT